MIHSMFFFSRYVDSKETETSFNRGQEEDHYYRFEVSSIVFRKKEWKGREGREGREPQRVRLWIIQCISLNRVNWNLTSILKESWNLESVDHKLLIVVKFYSLLITRSDLISGCLKISMYISPRQSKLKIVSPPPLIAWPVMFAKIATSFITLTTRK